MGEFKPCSSGVSLESMVSSGPVHAATSTNRHAMSLAVMVMRE
jgi:hypothetical protein